MRPDITLHARGRIIGAEFYPEDATPDEIVVRIAIPAFHPVASLRVVVIEEDYYDSRLPGADDVRGILGGEPA